MPKHLLSEYVYQESSTAVRNYLKKPQNVHHIKPRNVGLLINAALECPHQKPKQNLILILKVCAEVPEFKKYIEELGAAKLINE